MGFETWNLRLGSKNMVGVNPLADNFLRFNDYFRTFIKIITDIFSISIFLLCQLWLSPLNLILKPDFNKKFLILTL